MPIPFLFFCVHFTQQNERGEGTLKASSSKAPLLRYLRRNQLQEEKERLRIRMHYARLGRKPPPPPPEEAVEEQVVVKSGGEESEEIADKRRRAWGFS